MKVARYANDKTNICVSLVYVIKFDTQQRIREIEHEALEMSAKRVTNSKHMHIWITRFSSFQIFNSRFGTHRRQRAFHFYNIIIQQSSCSRCCVVSAFSPLSRRMENSLKRSNARNVVRVDDFICLWYIVRARVLCHCSWVFRWCGLRRFDMYFMHKTCKRVQWRSTATTFSVYTVFFVVVVVCRLFTLSCRSSSYVSYIGCFYAFAAPVEDSRIVVGKWWETCLHHNSTTHHRSSLGVWCSVVTMIDIKLSSTTTRSIHFTQLNEDNDVNVVSSSS